jgi:amino acid efflux transporter
MTTASAPSLSVPRGAALYIGALLGPGVLLLPGLASSIAGPAAIIAWVALLAVSALFAVVFLALAMRFPSGGGVATYTAAGLGQRAGNASAWTFLLAVVLGAPVVCLVGGSYVTALTGGGTVASTAVAAGLLVIVLTLGLRGARTTTTAQLVLVAVLIVAIVVAVGGSARSARASNWTPFTPHGWPAVGHAAAVVILAFVGWEAIAPLTPRFRDPARQLPRVIAIAFVVTAVVFLGLAAAPTAVLGAAAGGNAPVAGLMQVAIGPAGHAVAAVLAVIVTLSTVNAYLSGAVEMAQTLTRSPGSGPRLYYAIAATGLVILGLHGLRVVSTAELVTIPTTLFVLVYVGAMGAATVVLRGAVRWAAIPALVTVLVILAFSGWALALAVAVAGTAAIWAPFRSADDRSGDEDDLAAGASSRELLVRGGGVGESEGIAHEYPQGALIDQPHQHEAGGVAHLGAGIGAGAATEHLEAELEAPAEGDDRGDPIAIGDQLDAGVDCLVGAGRVERDVDPVGG